jgi:alpha-galactosidase
MKSRLLLALCLCCAVKLRAADTNAYILTPPAPATPRINGPDIFGVRPGSPVLYTIPATGDRPMTFSVKNLPSGLKVDSKTGRITGLLQGGKAAPANAKGSYFLAHQASAVGTHVVMLVAKNALGTAEKKFRIVVGDQIALTPPMGWNSWNCFAQAVTEDRVKSAADAMVKSGLINHGWTYINVDDFWQNHREPTSPDLRGPFRDTNGIIVPNSRFPDMKRMADYIHSLGLKAGLYSSPGPWTCGGCAGSFGYELQDAETYAKWGFDYLKYDWCSYNPSMESQRGTTNYPLNARNVVYAPANTQLERLEKPYALMGKLLRDQNRDIVFSLCQYGQGNVWQWGGSVDGNCWRITGDISDNWRSMSDNGFNKDRTAPYSKPGNWNDPDMLVVGQVGWGRLHPSHLTPDEQYTHISLWCLLSAPLLIGCDMTKFDDFTLNLLENDEVLALDQDALGKQATCVVTNGNVRVYEKELEDGGRALGFFNLGSSPANLEFNQLASLGFTGTQHVRDLWRQQNLPDVDAATGVLKMTIPVHGVVLYKLTAVAARN